MASGKELLWLRRPTFERTLFCWGTLCEDTLSPDPRVSERVGRTCWFSFFSLPAKTLPKYDNVAVCLHTHTRWTIHLISDFIKCYSAFVLFLFLFFFFGGGVCHIYRERKFISEIIWSTQHIIRFVGCNCTLWELIQYYWASLLILHPHMRENS